jgi:hypothetical protein
MLSRMHIRKNVNALASDSKHKIQTRKSVHGHVYFGTFEANNSFVRSLHRAHTPSRHCFERNPCSFLAQSVYLARRRNLQQFMIWADGAVYDVLTRSGCAACRMRSARGGHGTDPRCKSRRNLDGTPTVPKKEVLKSTYSHTHCTVKCTHTHLVHGRKQEHLQGVA